MICVRVDDRVRLAASDLPEVALADVRACFTHANPAFGKRPGSDEPERYETWRLDGSGELSVPRGGMGRLREVLRAYALPYGVEDARTWAHPEPGFPDHLRSERPYQARMRGAAEARQNCLLHGATGAGKTTVLYSLLARLKRRSLVMVWTENLLKQWRDRAVEELGMRAEDVGLVRGSVERIAPLTLAMQQTVAARFARGDRSLVDAFDVVCCDEVQRMAAETCYSAVDPFAARYRVGVSADHTRKDRKEFLIRDLFGDVVAEASEDETIAAGATVDVEVYVMPTSFRAPWYRYRQDFGRLLGQMVDDADRNAVALRIAEAVARQGEQVLLFTHRVEHARSLDAALVAAGVPSGVMVGGRRDSTAFDRTKEGIKAGALRSAVGTYQAIAQGLDLPTVSRGICVTPCANNRQQMGQVRGRICRSADGKAFGRLFYLWDSSVYGRRPIENFAKWFRVVRVWDGAAWVEARAWLRARKTAAA